MRRYWTGFGWKGRQVHDCLGEMDGIGRSPFGELTATEHHVNGAICRTREGRHGREAVELQVVEAARPASNDASVAGRSWQIERSVSWVHIHDQLRSAGRSASGQRQSFELVCLLARRSDGTGGTVQKGRRLGRRRWCGGLWLLPDGTKVGYQAKFFLKSGDIDWAQIDKSAEQALTKTHPTLTKYIVAIPCDLTDRRGAKSRGQTGWELWAAHTAKWYREWLCPMGRHVDFIAGTCAELRRQPYRTVRRRTAALLVRDRRVLRPSGSPAMIELATASLDERYHPEDHVDVGIEALFEFVTRHEAARRKLRDHLCG